MNEQRRGRFKSAYNMMATNQAKTTTATTTVTTA
jgi:hypothetical protein